MLKYFTLLVTISTLAIVNVPQSVNAAQIRLRSIKEGSYTKVIYVDTGNQDSFGLFMIIHLLNSLITVA